jgi:cellulose synthase/poly-beta-1,6-N-acetylglucosamine synthase-like glycosyltransferase
VPSNDQGPSDGIYALRDRWPERSAHVVLTQAQRYSFVVALGIVGVALLLWTVGTLQFLVAMTTVLYAAVIGFRVQLVWASTRAEHRLRVSDEEARSVADENLPIYTILVPAFHEPKVIGVLVEHLEAIEYPQHLLDVKLLLEADDEETIAAARDLTPRRHIELVIVPPSQPRTKPKACNYGLQIAKGEVVTIYDAEDRPEPLQLRRALVALRRLGPSYACLQAELSYFNSDQNRITRWFTLEYAAWFRSLLPGLVALNMPIPLGGTSNHFRTEVLRAIGAWDPFNVTEDADLGIRLGRRGYRVGVLDSVTLEEANCDFINWVRQRSRWYKGYLQTWLVHMRSPWASCAELGWRGILCLNLFVGGTPLTTLLNPLFWVMTVMWILDQPPLIQQLFVSPFYYLGLLCLVFGNATMIYLSVLTSRQIKRPDLLSSALTTPLYWAMMSLAGAKAMWQLVFQPSYWEKTIHGLHSPRQSVFGRGSVVD